MFTKQGSKVESDLLDNLYIAAPCPVRWDSMTGDDRERACSQCSRKVYNLSSMTKQEAQSFLQENGVNHCVTFFRREDGTIMTDNCPVGLRKLRDQYRLVMRVAAAAITFFMTPLAGFAKDAKECGTAKDAPISTNQARLEMVDGKPAIHPTAPPAPRKPLHPDIAGGAWIPPPVPGQAIFVPPSQPDRPVVSRPNLTDKPGNNTKDKTGTDPYYKLRAAVTELADPTAFNLYSLGHENLMSGRVLVARAYFKAALKAFDPTNHDWKLKQLVESELKQAESMPLTESEKEDDDAIVKIEFQGGKPRIIHSESSNQD